MRVLRPWLWLPFALVLPHSAQASLLGKLFYMLRSTAASAPAQKPKLPGQETRAFKLRKAHAEDVLAPLQSYLNGISKTGGSIQIRQDDNALVATDFPENLSRLGALIPDIDQAYQNDNAQARQMLVTQSLMKAIRNHPEASVASSRADRTPLARVNNGINSVPLSIYGPGSLTSSTRHTQTRDEDEMSPAPVRRWLDNPTLSQFEVVGWMQDEQGYMVILNNQGARFLYRHGKLHSGYSPKAKPLEGIDGVVHDNQLILNDGQSHVTLKMLKWRTL